MPLRPHWTDHDMHQLRAVTTHYDMLMVAFGILERMPRPIAQICGPISTGGKGSIKENFAVFTRAVDYLHRQGKNVFDQTPFEDPIVRIHYQNENAAYPVDLLSNFYLPIFESGLIAEAHFLPGWRDSRGATWEHGEFTRLGIPIFYFPSGWEIESPNVKGQISN